MRYTYRARNENGVLVLGSMKASHLDEIRDELKKQNLYLIMAKPEDRLFQFFHKGTIRNLVFFSKQFEVLSSTGLPVDKVLETIAQQATPKHFKNTLLDIRDSVVSGVKLSQAFAQHPKYFNEIFIAIVTAAESGAGLTTAMAEISTILSQEQEIKEKISTSGLYFKIVLSVSLAAVVLSSIYLFPVYEKFLKQFNKKGVEFPLITKFYMGFGKILIEYPIELSIITVLLFIFWRLFKKTDSGKLFSGQVSIRLPMLGPVHLEYANAAMARLLSLCLRTGMTTQDALQLVIQTTANRYVSKHLKKTCDLVLDGNTFSTAVESNPTLTPPLKAAFAVGEASGTLGSLLEVTAVAIEKHATYRLERANIAIQNMTVIIMGVIVLSIVLAIYSAMFSVYKAV